MGRCAAAGSRCAACRAAIVCTPAASTRCRQPSAGPSARTAPAVPMRGAPARSWTTENDMQTQTQRTILWIVFSMSLLFLWDGWQRHNGKPSLLGGPPAAQQAESGQGRSREGDGDASVPSAVPTAQGTTAAAQLPAADAEAVSKGQVFR